MCGGRTKKQFSLKLTLTAHTTHENIIIRLHSWVWPFRAVYPIGQQGFINKNEINLRVGSSKKRDILPSGNTSKFSTLNISTRPLGQGQHIGGIFGVRVVVRVTWTFLVFLGETLFHRDFLSTYRYRKTNIICIRPYIGQYAE